MSTEVSTNVITNDNVSTVFNAITEQHYSEAVKETSEYFKFAKDTTYKVFFQGLSSMEDTMPKSPTFGQQIPVATGIIRMSDEVPASKGKAAVPAIDIPFINADAVVVSTVKRMSEAGNVPCICFVTNQGEKVSKSGNRYSDFEIKRLVMSK